MLLRDRIAGYGTGAVNRVKVVASLANLHDTDLGGLRVAHAVERAERRPGMPNATRCLLHLLYADTGGYRQTARRLASTGRRRGSRSTARGSRPSAGR
jgi:hypothetical protein